MAMLAEYWQACGIEVDAEVLEIDRMEDAIAPLSEQTTQISALITAFSSCYHEADKEAERIIQAIGSGQPPVEEKERPPQRQRELQNSHDILSAWCEGDSARSVSENPVVGPACPELAEGRASVFSTGKDGEAGDIGAYRRCSRVFRSKTGGYIVGITSRYPIEIIEKRVEGMHHGLIHVRINGIDVIVTHFSPFQWSVRNKEAAIVAEKVKS
jgi:hypothetical protein